MRRRNSAGPERARRSWSSSASLAGGPARRGRTDVRTTRSHSAESRWRGNVVEELEATRGVEVQLENRITLLRPAGQGQNGRDRRQAGRDYIVEIVGGSGPPLLTGHVAVGFVGQQPPGRDRVADDRRPENKLANRLLVGVTAKPRRADLVHEPQDGRRVLERDSGSRRQASPEAVIASSNGSPTSNTEGCSPARA